MNPFQGSDENANSLSEKRIIHTIKKNNDVGDILSYTDIARRPPIQTHAADDASKNTKTNVIHQLPKRSSSTAVDIYSEIRSTKEEELTKIVENQQKMIEELQQEVMQLKMGKEDEQEHEDNEDERSNKKRKRDDDYKEDNEETLLKKVSELTEIIAKQDKELHQAREKLAESEYDYTENSTTPMATNASNDQTDFDTTSLMKNLESVIERKMNKIEKRFVSIEEKLKLDLQKQKENEKVVPSYSSALTKNIEKQIIGNVITAAKNTEKVQETERQRREKNIVIHGAKPNTGESDEQFIKNFLGTIGVSKKPSSISRLGQASDERIQPLKLTMETCECKIQIMRRLSNLKNSEERFRTLSVRDDHTFEERQLIKEWNAKTKSMNAAETSNEYFYKLRGSPKNGLRIIRVPWNKTELISETNMETQAEPTIQA